jgi:methionine-rich copper-binding protein CopC
MKIRKAYAASVIFLLLLAGVSLFATQALSASSAQGTDFGIPMKAAHYQSSTPSHGSVLSSVPSQVKINADMDMGPGGYIKVMKDGMDYGTGDAKLSADKKTLTRDIQANAPAGVYTVNYQLCWPDGSCHKGMYKFEVKK